MKTFKELSNKSPFSVGLWELKPNYENKELVSDINLKYLYSAYLYQLNLSFVKIDDTTCKESNTKRVFNISGSNIMYNADTGLFFYSNIVNDRISGHNRLSPEEAKDFFDYAEMLKSKDGKVRVLKK